MATGGWGGTGKRSVCHHEDLLGIYESHNAISYHRYYLHDTSLGAWGAPPKATTTRFDDDDEEVQPAYNAPQPTYNAPQPAYNAPPGRAPSSRQEPLAPQAPAAAFGGGSFGGGSSSGKIETVISISGLSGESRRFC